MRTIHKFAIAPGSWSEVEMPAASEIVSVQMQGDTLTAWAIVHTDSATVTRTFYIVGTGHPLPTPAWSSRFLATVQDGALVWHIFDGGER